MVQTLSNDNELACYTVEEWMMSQTDIKGLTATFKARVASDPQFKAKVVADPKGTLTAEGYPDALVVAVSREVTEGGIDDEVSGYDCVCTGCCITKIGRAF
jgi:hypothetical protein